MDDVFDTTGTPPKGWMNAIFDGGPYGEDVGRCVPGPPPADSFTVAGARYYLRSVGSWSDPDNPIALYGLKRSHLRQHPVSDLRHRALQRRLIVRLWVRRKLR